MRKVVLIALSGILFSSVVSATETEQKKITTSNLKHVKKSVVEMTAPNDAMSKTFEHVIEFQRLSLSSNDKQAMDLLKKLADEQKSLSVSLYNSGIFKIFTPLDWMQNEAQEGKIFVALIYLQKYPQFVTPKTLERIKQIAQNPSPTLKPIVDATLKMHDEYAKQHPYS